MQATDFPYQRPIDVIFHDIDAMGHVNNVVYLTYLETARIDYMWSLFKFERLGQLPLVIGDIYARYLAPAFFGDRLLVGVGVTRFGNKSFDFSYQIDRADGQSVLSARTTMVCFDYERQQTIRVPDWVRREVEQFQQGWQPPPDRLSNHA